MNWGVEIHIKQSSLRDKHALIATTTTKPFTYTAGYQFAPQTEASNPAPRLSIAKEVAEVMAILKVPFHCDSVSPAVTCSVPGTMVRESIKKLLKPVMPPQL